jgi:hypothetical protein
MLPDVGAGHNTVGRRTGRLLTPPVESIVSEGGPLRSEAKWFRAEKN